MADNTTIRDIVRWPDPSITRKNPFWNWVREATGYAQALEEISPADSQLSWDSWTLFGPMWETKREKGYPETERSGPFWRAMIDMPIRLPAARGIPASGPAAAGLPRARSVLWYCPESNLSSEHWAGGNAF